MPVFLL